MPAFELVPFALHRRPGDASEFQQVHDGIDARLERAQRRENECLVQQPAQWIDQLKPRSLFLRRIGGVNTGVSLALCTNLTVAHAALREGGLDCRQGKGAFVSVWG
jgi:hypothetical protein